MMIQVGFDNYVSLEVIRAVGHPGAAPMTRPMSQAREKGLLVDFTAGRRCKAIVILDSGQVVLSSPASAEVERQEAGDRSLSTE